MPNTASELIAAFDRLPPEEQHEFMILFLQRNPCMASPSTSIETKKPEEDDLLDLYDFEEDDMH